MKGHRKERYEEFMEHLRKDKLATLTYAEKMTAFTVLRQKVNQVYNESVPALMEDPTSSAICRAHLRHINDRIDALQHQVEHAERARKLGVKLPNETPMQREERWHREQQELIVSQFRNSRRLVKSILNDLNREYCSLEGIPTIEEDSNVPFNMNRPAPVIIPSSYEDSNSTGDTATTITQNGLSDPILSLPGSPVTSAIMSIHSYQRESPPPHRYPSPKNRVTAHSPSIINSPFPPVMIHSPYASPPCGATPRIIPDYGFYWANTLQSLLPQDPNELLDPDIVLLRNEPSYSPEEEYCPMYTSMERSTLSVVLQWDISLSVIIPKHVPVHPYFELWPGFKEEHIPNVIEILKSALSTKFNCYVDRVRVFYNDKGCSLPTHPNIQTKEEIIQSIVNNDPYSEDLDPAEILYQKLHRKGWPTSNTKSTNNTKNLPCSSSYLVVMPLQEGRCFASHADWGLFVYSLLDEMYKQILSHITFPAGAPVDILLPLVETYPLVAIDPRAFGAFRAFRTLTPQTQTLNLPQTKSIHLKTILSEYGQNNNLYDVLLTTSPKLPSPDRPNHIIKFTPTQRHLITHPEELYDMGDLIPTTMDLLDDQWCPSTIRTIPPSVARSIAHTLHYIQLHKNATNSSIPKITSTYADGRWNSAPLVLTPRMVQDTQSFDSDILSKLNSQHDHLRTLLNKQDILQKQLNPPPPAAISQPKAKKKKNKPQKSSSLLLSNNSQLTELESVPSTSADDIEEEVDWKDLREQQQQYIAKVKEKKKWMETHSFDEWIEFESRKASECKEENSIVKLPSIPSTDSRIALTGY